MDIIYINYFNLYIVKKLIFLFNINIIKKYNLIIQGKNGLQKISIKFN